MRSRGRYAEATDTLRSVKEEWASGDASIDAPRLAVRAKLLAAEGLDIQAERAVERALRLVDRTDWACLQADTLLTHAEVLGAAGRLGDAEPSLRKALQIAETKGYAVAEDRARALLDELGVAVGERVS